MRLVQAQVHTFKNILDSKSVDIEPAITCLVGKNESGKTAFLHALYRANPAHAAAKFSVQQHYPAWLEKLHRREGKNLEQTRPIRVVFELGAKDLSMLESRFGPGTFTSKELTVERDYSGKAWYTYHTNEQNAVRHVLRDAKVPADFAELAAKAATFTDIDELLQNLTKDGGESAKAAIDAITSTKAKLLGKAEDLRRAILDAMVQMTPVFFYFDEYSSLPGTIKIRELLNKKREDLSEEETTARSLLDLAGAESEYLLNADYEVRKRELENVANSITHDVLKYWSTNQELRVMIDITQRTLPAAPPQHGQQTVLDELKIRLWDDRHLLSLPFDQRSTGFRWFFSFLTAFSEFEHSTKPIIILLDEPGLGLHARAQKDFLHFIEDRLSRRCQVIYSTHSPFLIQPEHLERARLVEDKGREIGSQITSDVLSTDRDTIFPLQGALGYDLAQHLFVAPHNLVLEGTSDYTYLLLVSSFLKEKGREGLNDNWSLVPVGGADLVPSFVALLGNHLEVTVLIDSRKEGNQRLSRLVDQGILARNRIIGVGEITGAKLADIEDLFEPTEYLELYNRGFKASLTEADLIGSDPIVSRIARYLKVERFDHGRPADILLRQRDTFLPSLSANTLERFEKLFERINATLGAK
ncbi:MAG TPA: AAA family ATPase [Candidatus Acidoferrales bacterium]|nr:AAA family ATPase [Candidatus Acidoferrales bacterium]